MRKIRLPFFFFVAISLPLLTFLVIKLAKGYKFNFSKKIFEPRGILVTTSIPDGAQVFINGEFKTATNNTLPLSPGTYKVEIKKDGYFPWVKQLKIEKELVTKTDSWLFPAAPDLRPLTFTGSQNPVFSPDGTKIVYSSTASESGKGGFWLIDLVELPFGINRGPKQIIKPMAKGRNFSKASVSWSFNSRQILISKDNQNFLIDPNQISLEQDLVDISFDLKSIVSSWQEEEKKIFDSKFKRLPKNLQEIFQSSAENFEFSQDQEKLLYEATASAKIPLNLLPPVPAASTQKEEREIKPGRIYVYDLKEDRNFYIATIPEVKRKLSTAKSSEAFNSQITNYQLPITNFSWFPTSRHLLWVEPERISLIEYDGTNKTTIFTGPFENSYVFPAPEANKIIILTNFGQEANQPPNLYSINLR